MSKSDITLETDGTDPNGQCETHALKTRVSEINASFPTISPVQTESKRAKKRKMKINSPLVTFVSHVTSLKDFVKNYEIHQADYEEFASEHPNEIVNYSLDLHPDNTMTGNVVEVLREIQLNADSPFLFEYENDIHQDTDALNKQLDDAKNWLMDQDSNKIIVPVIDMKIRKEGLFLEKLGNLSNNYNRINVIYRSPLKHIDNWGDLKAFLKDNKIWCHMDCVLNRYDGDRIAHRVRLYAMGISSTSIGFPFGGSSSTKKAKKRIYQFNANSDTYEVLNPPHTPTFAERKDRAWITSLNDEIMKLQKMREHVIRKTLYTEYIPSIDDSGYLAFSEGI